MHFYENGCKLTLFDIDENNLLESKLLEYVSDQPTEMIYHIGDFSNFDTSQEKTRFDVLYLSSFTPDELHRFEINARIDPSDRVGNFPPWITANPFSPLVINALAMLKVGGLLILQSYMGGVDHRAHTGYLEACRVQLRRAGMTLLDVYAFQETLGIKLFVAVKGAEIIPRGRLTKFHGRSGVSEPIDHLFCA